MKWDDSALQLKKNVISNVPFFIRAFVDKTVIRAAEAVCRDKGIGLVGRDDVAVAFVTCTPKAMKGLMFKTLKGEGVDVSTSAGTDDDGPSFPIGEPMDKIEIEAFLAATVTGRLGTCADGVPYVVPLSFVYLDGVIYYHWFSYEGRKLQNIKKNLKVCFEADEYTRDHLNYCSVIANGTIRKVEEKQEKVKVMQSLARKFPEYATGTGHNREIQDIVDRGFEAIVDEVVIYGIHIETINGKKKGAIPR